MLVPALRVQLEHYAAKPCMFRLSSDLVRVTRRNNQDLGRTVRSSADVGINDAWSARRFAATQPAVRDMFASKPYNVQPTAWTVRRGNYDLLNFLNAAIETLLVSGRFEQMASAYDPSGRYKEQLTLVPFAEKK